MSKQSNQQQWPSLDNNQIIYRALLRKQWIDQDTQEINSDAYYLRKNKNEQGISVNIAGVISPQECAAKFRNCYGIVSLNVGEIRKLGLDVVPDSPNHANIIGLPYHEDNAAKAERLADLLANISQIVWLPYSGSTHDEVQ